MNKKENMAYWDEIDELCEEFTRELIGFSIPKVELEDDEVLYFQNEIRDFAVALVEKECKVKFPYVDENY